MYMLACADAYRYPGHDPPYVLDIFPLTTGLAATSSDQSLSLFNPLSLAQGPVKRLSTHHGNLTAARPFDPTRSIVCTAGENGTATLWDLRLDPSGSQVLQLGGLADPARGNQASILSLACSVEGHAVAVGTELANHQASILTWDVRSSANPRIQYNEVHSDDVTELNFHPSEPHIVLSGSTDGLVNICDTRIADEDEVVVQTFNHGSVHHAGFLNNTELYAASHDEKFALYDMAEEYENGSATLDFGDIREVLGCQYLANVFPKLGGAGAVIGVGSQDQQLFQLIHLSKEAGWTLNKETTVGLPGGHGSEIVRSFRFFDEEQLVLTAGEDGHIKAWRPNA